MRPSMISALSSRRAEGDEGSCRRHAWAGEEHRRQDPSSLSLLGMTGSNQFQLTANRAVLAAALIAAAVTACADAAPTTSTDPLPSVSSVKSRASVTELRVVGDCETEFAPPPFPLPPAIRQIDTGTCRIAHLGRSAFYAEQDISFATGSSTSADVRFTAANGDVLRATSVGVFVPNGPGVRISGVLTFAGGTGRFVNATGEARIEGQVDFITNTTRFSFVDGWLTYR